MNSSRATRRMASAFGMSRNTIERTRGWYKFTSYRDDYMYI